MSILTQDDKQNIRDVWAKVFENAEENGKVVVIRLFVDHPETKKYFKNFKNIATEEELEKNARVKLHGKKVMNALNEVVENMDDWGAVVEILTPLAEKHKDVHKVGVHNFKLLFEVIINVYKDALGASFTPPSASLGGKSSSSSLTSWKLSTQTPASRKTGPSEEKSGGITSDVCTSPGSPLRLII